MKTKNLIITVLLVVIISTKVNAQESLTHEFGIQLSSLLSFSAIYKKEREANKYVRIQMGGGELSRGYIQDKDPNKKFSFNFSGGLEKRKPISEKTNLISGLAPFVSLLYRNEFGQKLSRTQVGIAYILGIQYLINNQFYVSLESMPSLSGFLSKLSNSDTEVGGSIGFYNNIANITIAHRFKLARRTNNR